MNQGSAISKEPISVEQRKGEPYFKWVSTHFPLLHSWNLEHEYGVKMLRRMSSLQKEAVPESQDGRVAIFVNSKNDIYTNDLKLAALKQFQNLCSAARNEDKLGKEARQFLSYLVLSNGYPSYDEMQEQLADAGALVIRELMENEDFRTDLHSAVSGIVAYSQNARASLRLIMLEAFCLYFTNNLTRKPNRRELSSILFDALNLELRRPKANQSIEFQDRLISLLSKHPHPATRVVLSVLANEHSDELVRKHAQDALMKLQESLLAIWEATTPDQVSTEEFRTMSLAEVMLLETGNVDRIQAIFNACKGMNISDLSDRRLAQLQVLMNNRDDLICLAAAIALSQIYVIELPCEVAGKAISILTDWAINSQEGCYVLDALSAVNKFETLSEASRLKVGTAFAAANLRFVIREQNE